jgi:hypothetical protein
MNGNWRIRECAVKLLGELLYKIAGTSGKVKLDGGSDEEGAATESYANALVATLGVDTRNRVLARLYLVRCVCVHTQHVLAALSCAQSALRRGPTSTLTNR